MTDDMNDGNDSGDLTEVEPRRLWPVIAPIVLVLLAAMLIFTVGAGLLGDDDDGAQADPPVTRGPIDPDSSPADPNASLCGLEGNVDSGTVTSPPGDAEWVRVGATAIPVSPSAGPGVVEDTQVRYCYARTPEGVVLAATNLYAWGVASALDAVGVIEHGVATGPGYDEALAMATDPNTVGGQTQDPSIQIAGFQLVTYTAKAALVSVAFKFGSQPGYAQQSLTLLWDRGDWRIRSTPDGSLPSATVVPDLTGYVVWSGA